MFSVRGLLKMTSAYFWTPTCLVSNTALSKFEILIWKVKMPFHWKSLIVVLPLGWKITSQFVPLFLEKKISSNAPVELLCSNLFLNWEACSCCWKLSGSNRCSMFDAPKKYYKYIETWSFFPRWKNTNRIFLPTILE